MFYSNRRKLKRRCTWTFLVSADFAVRTCERSIRHLSGNILNLPKWKNRIPVKTLLNAPTVWMTAIAHQVLTELRANIVRMLQNRSISDTGGNFFSIHVFVSYLIVVLVAQFCHHRRPFAWELEVVYILSKQYIMVWFTQFTYGNVERTPEDLCAFDLRIYVK